MSEYAIELNGVCKSYRFFELQNIALRLHCGTIMGLIGPNGAGKSTTIRILMGLVHQDRGEVRVLGHRMPDDQVWCWTSRRRVSIRWRGMKSCAS